MEVFQTAQSRANGAAMAAQTRATGAVQSAQSRATEAVQTARAKAADRYDTLAAHGRQVMNGQPGTGEATTSTAGPVNHELNGKATAPTDTTTTL